MAFTLRIDHDGHRERLHQLVASAPDGTWVTLKPSKRTLKQNDRMWAILTQISLQCVWHGVRYTPEDWKEFFCHSLHREARWMPAEDGGAIPIGIRTSKMEKQEFNDLMALMEAFAARQGIEIEDPKAKAA